MALRILHQFIRPTGVDADALLASEAATLRGLDGCREAEAYRGLRDPEQVAVVQLWEDEDAYAAHLTAGPATLPVVLAARDEGSTEIYSHGYFAPVDGVWTAESQQGDRRVVWPARGEVRIVIQTCLADTAAERPALVANELETLREPGCREFAWMSSVEVPGHVLLLETWASQRIYDQHWVLRRRTGSAPARQRGERIHGTDGAEFYRRQEFRLLYGHWLPAEPDAASTTVLWPS